MEIKILEKKTEIEKFEIQDSTLNAWRALHPMSCRVLCSTARVYRNDSFPFSVFSLSSSTAIYVSLATSAIPTEPKQQIDSSHVQSNAKLTCRKTTTLNRTPNQITDVPTWIWENFPIKSVKTIENRKARRFGAMQVCKTMNQEKEKEISRWYLKAKLIGTECAPHHRVLREDVRLC